MNFPGPEKTAGRIHSEREEPVGFSVTDPFCGSEHQANFVFRDIISTVEDPMIARRVNPPLTEKQKGTYPTKRKQTESEYDGENRPPPFVGNVLSSSPARSGEHQIMHRLQAARAVKPKSSSTFLARDENAGSLLSRSLIESERFDFRRQFPQRIHPRFSGGGGILDQVVEAGLSNYDDEMGDTAG